eukprot:CAMPEP_0178897380 /NCGR_PEP_ID=MMETSP0786-20121207/1710_1 /TAXON_ID=186022 /ORGANISM="Thalassionema frauenfeldii, Strain CCMP 1798" /LENGTH=1089 /DNA_ID=CAMNT_0020567915 /DNA_START=191 /DNA_END=3461 /DNA_ORIENTATION=+
MEPDISRTLKLAAVARQLLEDEGSSLDSWTDGNDSCKQEISSDSSSPSSSARPRIDCETPPRLERTHKVEYAARSENDATNESSSPRLQDAGVALATVFDVPSMLGMHAFSTEKRTPSRHFKSDEDDDNLSFTDSSVDSVELLQRRALEIRHELRIRELREIAHVAERAAAAGHDSFAGQASTFIGDSSNCVASSSELKAFPMKRYSSYTEGSRRRKIVKPLLRRAKTDSKRKIPVMALRHIDDLIPPMQQLHNHLRKHFSSCGVDTENSIVADSIETTSLEMVEQVEDTARSDASSDISFIAKMKEWVTKPAASIHSESGETGFTSQELDSSSNVDPEMAFERGDTLSEHITSTVVARGQWRPSPIQVPDGFAYSTEYIPHNKYATPRRRPSVAMLWKNFGNIPQEPSVTTAVTSSISSEVADAEQQQSDLTGVMQTSNQDSDIIPVALFDSDEDDDDGGENQTEEFELGSKKFPKPFEIQTFDKEEHQSPEQDRRKIIEPPSPNSMPNLFITPVRLKGIRHASLLRSGSYRRSSLHWGGFSRADSFLSDSGLGTPIKGSLGGGQGNFVEDSKLGENLQNLSKLDVSNITSESSTNVFLKPRCQKVNPAFDAIDIDDVKISSNSNYTDNIEIETTHINLPSYHSEERRQEMPVSRSKDDDIESNLQDGVLMTPTRNERESNSFDIEGTPNLKAVTAESTMQPSLSPEEALHPVQQPQSSITTTPMPQGCECMQLTSSAHISKQSSVNVGRPTVIKDSSLAQPIGFRRVTSCPSLAKASNNQDSAHTNTHELRNRTIFQVLDRLSPSNRPRSKSRIDIGIKENHDFLNNYLYFSKPSSGRSRSVIRDPAVKPFCIEPCEVHGACEKPIPVGCEALSAVSDTACVLFKRPEKGCKDLIQTTNDYAGFESRFQENWFDVASARFDVAIEQLVGAAHHNPHSRWGEAFQAPTLTIKTPQHGHRKSNPRKIKDFQGSEYPIDITNGLVEGQVTSIPDSPTPFAKTASRDDVRAFNKDKGLALLRGHHHPIVFPQSTSAGWVPPPRPRHKATYSASDISEIWVQAQIDRIDKKKPTQEDQIGLREIEAHGRTTE